MILGLVRLHYSVGALVLMLLDDIFTVGITSSYFIFIIYDFHTVYPVTPNAGMFYQRGYKQ